MSLGDFLADESKASAPIPNLSSAQWHTYLLVAETGGSWADEMVSAILKSSEASTISIYRPFVLKVLYSNALFFPI